LSHRNNPNYSVC